MALILTTLKNLRTLDLGVTNNRAYASFLSHSLWYSRRRLTSKAKKPLRDLSNVYLGNASETCGADPTLIPFVLSLNNLQRLCLDNIKGGRGVRTGWNFARFNKFGISTCKHLELRDCCLNPHNFHHLFKYPKMLKTVVYEMGEGQYKNRPVSFKNVRKAIDLHKASIEQLCLDYNHQLNGEWSMHYFKDAAAMPPLLGYQSLKRLKIAPDFIYGIKEHWPNKDLTKRYIRVFEFLPMTIESLHLTHCETPVIQPMIIRALKHIIENKKKWLPRLSKILVELHEEIVVKRADEFAEVLQMATSVGIEFVMINNALDMEKQANEDFSHVEGRLRKWGWKNVEWHIERGFSPSVYLKNEVIDFAAIAPKPE
jgi:hypothetical protein